jgi:hypothetical protein
MRLFRVVLLWLAVAAATFIFFVIANSVGAAAYGDPLSYGSSTLQQVISRAGKILLHVLPGIAVGFTRQPRGWILASVMSLIGVAACWWYFRGAFGTLLLSFPSVEAACLVLLGAVAAKGTSFLRTGRPVR